MPAIEIETVVVRGRVKETIRHIDAGTPEEEREAFEELLRYHLGLVAKREAAALAPSEGEKVAA